MTLFDTVIIRDENCRKLGQRRQMFGTDDVLPLWIADMDFRTPEPIINTLHSVIMQPVQGYNLDFPRWKMAVINWYAQRYAAGIDETWLHFMPGVIKGIVFSLLALTRPEDNILTCSPVYDPYANFIMSSGRKLVQTRLIENHGRYDIDWSDFAEKLRRCRMFIFSSPHNPGGVVWSKETLDKIHDYCRQAGVVVVVDEIHGDLTLPGYRHIPFFTLDDAAQSEIIVFTSISKTFNTPGIQGGIAIVPNNELRRQFYTFLDNCYLGETNTLQQAAIYSAYSDCGDWQQKLLAYLSANVAFVKQEIARHCPLISVIYGGASYLLFLNAEKMGLSDEQLKHFFVHDARLGLSPGVQYGEGGERHMRLNVACPRSVLVEAMGRLKEAYGRR